MASRPRPQDEGRDLWGWFSGLVALGVYLNTLQAGFVYDDSRAVLGNPDLLPTTPIRNLFKNDYWGTSLDSNSSHGSYRPLCVLSYRLNYQLFGFQPWAFHGTNILLHALATYLVYRTVKTLFLQKNISISTSLLFAVHPIHTENVAGIVGRADILSCIFFLLSFLFYLKHVRVRYRCIKSFAEPPRESARKRWAEGASCATRNECLKWFWLCSSLLMAVCSTLCKETGITVLLACVGYEFIHYYQFRKLLPSIKRRIISQSLVFVLASLGLLFLCRLHLMSYRLPTFATADNPTAKEPRLLVRLLTFLYLPIFNLKLLLLPSNLSFDWSMDAIPRIKTLFDVRNLYTAAFYTALAMIVRKATNSLRKSDTRCNASNICDTRTRYSPQKRCAQCNESVCGLEECGFHANNNTIHINRNFPSGPQSFGSNAYGKVCFQSSSLCFSRKSEVVLTVLVFLVFPFLPSSNLLFYVGFVLAERVLYIPSLGFCLAVAFGFHVLSSRTNRRKASFCFVALLVVLSARTVHRNRDWFDEEALYSSGVSINPPKAYGNLGSVLSSKGRIQEAEKAFRMALSFRPNMADVHYNLGLLLQGKGSHEEAIICYKLAIHYRPSLAVAYLNLGQLLSTQGKEQEAEQILTKGSQLPGEGLKDPKAHMTAQVSAMVHLGQLYMKRGEFESAANSYRQALRHVNIYPQPQVLYSLLGESLSHLGFQAEAEKWYQTALQVKPDHVPAYLTYGKLLAKNRTRLYEAEHWFRRAKKLSPNDPQVYQHFGQFLCQNERFAEAVPIWIRATELAPHQNELLIGAATALRQAGQIAKSEKYYRKALMHSPWDPNSHSNLGAILHLQGKYSEAIVHYNEALRIEPEDQITLQNIQKLQRILLRRNLKT
ncbi:protein O-mannosyl-transferase TMTC2 [Bemisia tabaci]|uniref:protein O-mannosyl-transferase TMTC2 n=1 Tax=Bemisia tabaci TaxID=7038 RepID=UPI003B27B618